MPPKITTSPYDLQNKIAVSKDPLQKLHFYNELLKQRIRESDQRQKQQQRRFERELQTLAKQKATLAHPIDHLMNKIHQKSALLNTQEATLRQFINTVLTPEIQTSQQLRALTAQEKSHAGRVLRKKQAALFTTLKTLIDAFMTQDQHLPHWVHVIDDLASIDFKRMAQNTSSFLRLVAKSVESATVALGEIQQRIEQLKTYNQQLTALTHRLIDLNRRLSDHFFNVSAASSPMLSLHRPSASDLPYHQHLCPTLSLCSSLSSLGSVGQQKAADIASPVSLATSVTPS